jgi:repressor LexA
LAKKQSKPTKSLTPKEKAVLEFLESYYLEHAMAPSYREIKDHFGYASYYSVQRYLKQLEDKGYIALGESNEKRAISLLASADEVTSLKVASSSQSQRERVESSLAPNSLSLPLLGKVAAGSPIEHLKHDEYLDVPDSMVKQSDKSFVLQVEGDSMIEDGIFDGDFLIIQKQTTAEKGDTIVAMVNSEATVKNFFKHSGIKSSKLEKKYHKYISAGKNIELRPANASLDSMFFHPKEVEIQGIVVGLLRRY